MEFSVKSYFNNQNINFKSIKNVPKHSHFDVKNNKNFLPDITLFDTGITDPRLECLIVEKRERMFKNCLVPPEYTYTDEYGIDRLKPHLFIKRIVVKPEFLRQGACRDAELKIIQLSKDEGYEGRVLLESSLVKGKFSYIPSPTLAHWANGFRFWSENCLKQMMEVLNGTRPPEEAPGGEMYYPIL